MKVILKRTVYSKRKYTVGGCFAQTEVQRVKKHPAAAACLLPLLSSVLGEFLEGRRRDCENGERERERAIVSPLRIALR